jgi:hypothetical protein
VDQLTWTEKKKRTGKGKIPVMRSWHHKDPDPNIFFCFVSVFILIYIINLFLGKLLPIQPMSLEVAKIHMNGFRKVLMLSKTRPCCF